MKGKSNSIRVVTRNYDDRQLHSVVAETVILAVLISGISLLMEETFTSANVSFSFLFFPGIVFGMCLICLYNTKASRWVLPSVIILTVAVCIVFSNEIFAGIGCLGNNIQNLYTAKYGEITLDYSVADQKYAGLGLYVVLAVIVMLFSRSVWNGQIITSAPVLAVVYIAVVIGLVPFEGACVLIALGVVLLLIQKNCGGIDGVPSHLLVIAVCIALGLLLGNNLNIGRGFSDSVSYKIHVMQHHTGNESMPEGRLRNLGKRNVSAEPSIELILETPEKMYLRGAVYEVYDGASWKKVQPDSIFEYEDDFFWLHEGGFFGQSQISIAGRYVSEREASRMTINNLATCDAHGYYPYAVQGIELFDANRIGDVSFASIEAMNYIEGSVPEWYDIQQKLSSAQSRGNISEFLAMEQLYENYVSAMDLQMTQDSWEVIDRQLETQDEGKTLSDIRGIIRDYLEEHLVYDEKIRTLNGNGDFLQYTLEQSGSGYSVHYATAATLMLRYFGVPARYVEGYFLSAEEAERYDAGESIVLTEKNAHAWAEYYLSGVGFIPFEVTPGFLDDEELSLSGSNANEQTYGGNQLRYAQVQRPEKIEEPEQDRMTFSMNPIWLLAFIPVALIFMVLLIFVRRRKLIAKMKEMDMAENRESIAMRFGYAMFLLSHCSTDLPKGYDDAKKLNEQALFSNYDMSDLQRKSMEQFAETVLTLCKNSWTLSKKIRYRIWDCLY